MYVESRAATSFARGTAPQRASRHGFVARLPDFVVRLAGLRMTASANCSMSASVSRADDMGGQDRMETAARQRRTARMGWVRLSRERVGRGRGGDEHPPPFLS